MTPPPNGSELARRAREGDRRALARLLSEVEARSAEGEAGLRALFGHSGKAHLVGVTGAPGTGKSTLVAALVRALRATGRSVAVVAVDPSSPITGGAILGDRVRMQEHAGDRDVFIRSMASRGHSGGLAASSIDAATVLDGVGFQVVIFETVGAGQSEVEVAAAADTTVVVEAPGLGDEIQALKAGLLEVADVIVVNKGDRPGAARTASQLRAMINAAAAPAADDGRPRPKRPDVLVATATTGEGVPELLEALDRHRARLAEHRDDAAPLARADAQLQAALTDRLRERLAGDGRSARDTMVRSIAEHRVDPWTAADRVLASLAERDGEVG